MLVACRGRKWQKQRERESKWVWRWECASNTISLVYNNDSKRVAEGSIRYERQHKGQFLFKKNPDWTYQLGFPCDWHWLWMSCFLRWMCWPILQNEASTWAKWKIFNAPKIYEKYCTYDCSRNWMVREDSLLHSDWIRIHRFLVWHSLNRIVPIRASKFVEWENHLPSSYFPTIRCWHHCQRCPMTVSCAFSMTYSRCANYCSRSPTAFVQSTNSNGMRSHSCPTHSSNQTNWLGCPAISVHDDGCDFDGPVDLSMWPIPWFAIVARFS